MSLPPEIAKRLRLPVICSPLFIISNPDLTIAQCKAGVVGSFPSLNARPLSQLDEWLARITEELAAWDREHPDQPSAPFAVWSYAAQPLAEALDELRRSSSAVNLTLQEPWLRRHQVLPRRLYPPRHRQPRPRCPNLPSRPLPLLRPSRRVAPSPR